MTPEQWQRAKLVLEGAKRHSPSDRSQYVSVACSDDPELLKEVESLLNLSSTPSASRPIDPSGPALTQWEHLTVLAEVGRGAFGRVYRAWDPALQMEVALKLIRVDAHEPDFAESVFHEARLLVKVRHPHVVTVLGARRVGSEVGIWMEFINGPTLADAVERGGPMGPVEAAAAGISVCDALAAVHGAGLLHRDIKARNVMRDASGRVVLMDFGAGASRRDQPHGEMAGTPLYMAPEVLKGAGASIASDIYSVGVLLFHLATGEYPVTGHNIYELEAAHESGARTRLADRRPDLPDVFVEAVDRALSPDPEERFRRAVEFRDALSEATAHITAPVAVPPAAALLERWPWIAALVVAAALVSVTFLGFITSAAFNQMLGRDGGFLDESAIDWPAWGVKAVLAPALYMGVMFLAGVVIRWLLSFAMAAVRRLRGRPARVARPRISAQNPNVPVRLAAGFGIVALVLIPWQFSEVLEAITTWVDIQGPDERAALAPEALPRFYYRRALELTMLVVGLGVYRGLRLKRESGIRLDASAMSCCVGVMLVALLMTVIPFRILHHNQFPRVQLDGMRCYVLGQDAGQLLLHCPESPGRHNRTVPANDSRLTIEGINESIFIPESEAAPVEGQ